MGHGCVCCVSLLLHSSFLPFCSPLILVLLFSHSLSLCLFVDTSGRGLCPSTHRMGQIRYTPTQRITLSAQSVPSRPLWPCSHRMCVSQPRDWAAFVGSHVQQDIGILFWPFHLSAHGVPLLETSDNDPKIGDSFH